MISLAMLSGCTAASHPSALSAAAPGSAVAATVSVPDSPSISVAASPQPSALPATAASRASITGTPTSAADSSPTALSSTDIATGVRATAQAFFDDFNLAFATGDVTAIEALTSPACGCRSLANTIKQTTAKKQRFVGVVAKLTSLHVVSFIAAGATADVYYTISAGRILDVDGSQVNTTLADTDQHSAMFVMRTDSRWIVQQNTLLNAPTG
jgi:Family of unknown function (DUF6318)